MIDIDTIIDDETKVRSNHVILSPYRLILHNDDYNTFDWVTSCLITICGHEYEQAVQCSHIIHNNGKCDVKFGPHDKLSIMKENLKSAGLIVTMEEN